MLRRGFTMVEMTVVVLIIALTAAAVSLRIGAPMSQAHLAQVCNRVTGIDDLSRTYARQQNKLLVMLFDLDRQQLQRVNESGRAVGQPLKLPSGARMATMLLDGRKFTGGVVSIKCNRMGLSSSYAVLLDAKEWKQWILVSGLTGQASMVKDEKEAMQILDLEGVKQGSIPG